MRKSTRQNSTDQSSTDRNGVDTRQTEENRRGRKRRSSRIAEVDSENNNDSENSANAEDISGNKRKSMNDSYQSQCKLARSSTEPIVKQKTDDVVRDAPSSDGQKELHPSFNHLVGNADQQNSGMSSTSDEGNLPQFRSLELEVLHPNLPPVDLPYAFWCISMDTLLGPSSNRSSASECTSHEDSEDPDMSYAVEDIDADGDVHWASCYANDLYEHFKTQERIMSPIPGFMERQSNISESNRANLINIMMNITRLMRTNRSVNYLAVDILDRFFMNNSNVSKGDLVFLGVTCILIACKHDELSGKYVIDDIIDRLPESYNAVEVRRKIVIAEKIILRTIHWQVGMPTIDTFLQRFAQAGRLNSVCTSLARCISERSLLEYEMINFNPSEIAAASICVARSLEKHAPWNSTLVHYTGYTQENLRPCVECLQNIFHNEMNARAKNYVFKLVEEMGLDRSILLRCLRLLPSLSPDCLLGAISNDPNVATIDRLTVDNDMTQLAANTLMELTFQSSNARSVVGHGTGNDSTIYDNTNFAFARYNSTGSMSPAADHQKRLRENRILSYQSLIRTILKSDDDFVSDLSSLFFELLGHYRSCCENGNDLTTVRVDDLNNAELQDILIEKISTGVTLSTVFDSVKDRYQHVYDRIVTCPP